MSLKKGAGVRIAILEKQRFTLALSLSGDSAGLRRLLANIPVQRVKWRYFTS
jgi:hypothetical protein